MIYLREIETLKNSLETLSSKLDALDSKAFGLADMMQDLQRLERLLKNSSSPSGNT